MSTGNSCAELSPGIVCVSSTSLSPSMTVRENLLKITHVSQPLHFPLGENVRRRTSVLDLRSLAAIGVQLARKRLGPVLPSELL